MLIKHQSIRFILSLIVIVVAAPITMARASAILDFTPSMGPPGTQVTITGIGFTGASSVTFASTPATFTVESDTRLSARVPFGASNGPISVTTPDGTTSSSTSFKVSPPNIVLILTDDQRFDELNPPGLVNMPTVRSALQANGLTFSNAFVPNPLCCPSRTSILTGKYSHTTDVYGNAPPHGGFGTFTNTNQDQSTIATWLQGGGYETALIGKYLNGYPRRPDYVPPGWDTWDAFSDGPPGGAFYYDYKMNHNGSTVSYGSAPGDYSTDVLANHAKSVIESAPSNKPLFLYFSTSAPHGPFTPPPRYADAYPDLQPLDEPSIEEGDVSDKPAYIRSLPKTPVTQPDAERSRRMQFQDLLGVDDAVGTITQALRDSGRLSSSLIVFASDNGIELGEHRWVGKRVPYEESIHVPLVVRYDPIIEQAGIDSHLVLNVDLAPTFAQLGGVTDPGAEGKSLLPLLMSSGQAWRTNFLIEHEDFNTPYVPAYCGVRTAGWKYVEYATEEEELYNLQQDPYEVNNLLVTKPNAPAVASKRQTLHTWMLELCSPAPPGFTPLNPDTTPPANVTGLRASSVTSSSVRLNWQASGDDVGVLGYTVYRDGVRIGTTESLPTPDESSDAMTSYTDTTVRAGTTYSYTVDAYDTSDNHSTRSQGVSVTTLTARPVLAAAGDIACDPADKSFKGGLGTTSACRMRSTSDLIDPTVSGVLALGNEQYVCGGSVGFAKSYDPTWGRSKAITHPVPGDREYAKGSTAKGCSPTGSGAPYFGYFGAAAGDPSRGYYSFDVPVPSGDPWHIIGLNSNCSKIGGCGVGSAQEQWLQNDLSTHPATCTLAYWNAPRFSSQANQPRFDPFWQDLSRAGADVILNAGDADYERFAPQDPGGLRDDATGIVEFIVGTGGAHHAGVPTTRAPNSLVFNRATFGVLRLTLGPIGFDWNFVPEPGKTFSDAGTRACH